jgi:hypothetical protein
LRKEKEKMKEEIIATCPFVKCGKVIFRKLRADIETDKKTVIDFITICPHCHNKVKIIINLDIKTNPVYD